MEIYPDGEIEVETEIGIVTGCYILADGVVTMWCKEIKACIVQEESVEQACIELAISVEVISDYWIDDNLKGILPGH